VAGTVRAVIELGVAGINLEDSPGRDGRQLLDPGPQAERIAAAREEARAAGCELFINARTDVYLFGVGAPESRLAEVQTAIGAKLDELAASIRAAATDGRPAALANAAVS